MSNREQLNRRKYATNPRATGTNPRALGTNPRSLRRGLGQDAVAADDAADINETSHCKPPAIVS